MCLQRLLSFMNQSLIFRADEHIYYQLFNKDKRPNRAMQYFMLSMDLIVVSSFNGLGTI